MKYHLEPCEVNKLLLLSLFNYTVSTCRVGEEDQAVQSITFDWLPMESRGGVVVSPLAYHAGHLGSSPGVEGTVTKCTNLALNSVDCVSTVARTWHRGDIKDPRGRRQGPGQNSQ